MNDLIKRLDDLVGYGDFPDLMTKQREVLDRLRLWAPPQEPFLGLPRASGWEKFAREWIEENPTCAACGGKEHLQLHHKKPFHNHRELELSKKNVITLCMAPNRLCHFILGHLFNWSSWNDEVEEMSAKMLEKVLGRPH
jgi:5-methylcytosine-specific restriction endonuclease McrA